MSLPLRRHVALFLTLILFLTPGAAPAAEPPPAWQSYRTILWLSGNTFKQSPSPEALLAALREMGINTGMISRSGDPTIFSRDGFPFYVENVVSRGLCLKYNSRVTNWSQFVDDWAKGGRLPEGFIRDYCLDDPAWLKTSADEARATATRMAPHGAIAYDLRDELSTTISANPFDYDFSPVALAAFRTWLKTQYADLDALNRQWETRFAAWDDVIPFSTDQIKARMIGADPAKGAPDWSAVKRVTFEPSAALREPARWNLSPWCDFRTYMDISLARTLDSLRSAMHEADPHTPVGIEGTQMASAWGGYDLWRLSRVLDWVEPYDVANAREIWGSFMPGKPMLTTIGEKDARAAQRRLWHLLLQGDRGCIVWWSEDCLEARDGKFALTPRAQELASVLREMTSPLAALFLRAQREIDPIAIHYSQASIQVDWLLESTRDGSTWPRRFSSHEGTHNRLAQTRNDWLKALQDLGYTPRFISTEQLEKGDLAGAQVLVLPDSLALSDAEIAQLTILAPRVTLLGEGIPGVFDEHGRLRRQPPPLPLPKPGMREYARLRMNDRMVSEMSAHAFDAVLKVPRAIPLDPAARVALTRYTLGDARLLAFERNIDYRMSEELLQAGGNEQLEKPVSISVPLPTESHVYDLRNGKYLGRVRQLEATIDPWVPSLFAILPQRAPEDDVMRALGAR